MKKFKKSEIFWNSIPVIIQIIIAFIRFDIFIMIQICLPMLYPFFDGTEIKPPIFLKINFIFGIWYLINQIIKYNKKAFKWIINNPIYKFNNWLDKEKEELLSFKKFKKKLK